MKKLTGSASRTRGIRPLVLAASRQPQQIKSLSSRTEFSSPHLLTFARGDRRLWAGAYEFLDFLAAAARIVAGFARWVLPQSASAVLSTSAFAGNPLLLSLERLAERGWLIIRELLNRRTIR